MKKTIVAVALVLIFVFALAAPAFAQSMVHTGVVKANGNIWSNKQVGHLCNTGSQQTKSIRGNGELTNDFSITMVSGKTVVVDKNDFVSQAGTAAPLVITSEIRLCTPAKYTYKDTVDGVQTEAPVDIMALYPLDADASMPAYYDANSELQGTTVGALAKAVTGGKGAWKALTTQTWAAQVKADAGFSGKLYQDYEAAYGRYLGQATARTADAAALSGNAANRWAWGTSATNATRADVGAGFVGDYFKMSQTARTSMGEVSRYIDISSPWSHAYLHEDSVMTGFAEVVETFNMTNLGAGADVPGKWWTGLFTKR